ncbi:hypothetical protein CEXT_63511 [Caerostris extrusa]|uniref:Uncharacterized protein n=1 Tax=Caerostris extrusa TaxID=172846 RepID=A0AAV4YBI1_CAEEX|nr:hypothetical protein CEXT_63511 [Caerostris extrusa]
MRRSDFFARLSAFRFLSPESHQFPIKCDESIKYEETGQHPDPVIMWWKGCSQIMAAHKPRRTVCVTSFVRDHAMGRFVGYFDDLPPSFRLTS